MLNKRQRKLKGQSRISNPETPATLGTEHRTKTYVQNNKHNTEH